jgi:hypothetical protein
LNVELFGALPNTPKSWITFIEFGNVKTTWINLSCKILS